MDLDEQEKLEDYFKQKRARAKQKSMKVSGKNIFNLQKIIEKKWSVNQIKKKRK